MQAVMQCVVYAKRYNGKEMWLTQVEEMILCKRGLGCLRRHVLQHHHVDFQIRFQRRAADVHVKRCPVTAQTACVREISADVKAQWYQQIREADFCAEC
jgi:hypothetical protein